MACYKRCVSSLFLLQLLLLLSSISSSSSKTLKGSDQSPSRSQILASTKNDAFSGKQTETDVTSDGYYNVGGRKMAGVKIMNNIGATDINEGMKKKKKKKICKEGAVKQSRGGYGSEEEDSKVEEEAGFVAFNADYHTPRHHPPKNN